MDVMKIIESIKLKEVGDILFDFDRLNLLVFSKTKKK